MTAPRFRRIFNAFRSVEFRRSPLIDPGLAIQARRSVAFSSAHSLSLDGFAAARFSMEFHVNRQRQAGLSGFLRNGDFYHHFEREGWSNRGRSWLPIRYGFP